MVNWRHVLITYRGLTTLNSWHETGLVKDQFSKQTLLSVLLLLHSNHHFSSVLGLSVCWAQINLMGVMIGAYTRNCKCNYVVITQ
jgi:hypothetical protein